MKKVEIVSKLPTIFSRNLEDGQELCPECGGIQLVCDGNYIKTCQTCLGKKGILTRCQYCGELATYNHKCHGMKEAERLERCAREKAKWDKVPKITLEEAIKRFVMVFIDLGDGEYIMSDMLEEWIEDREEEDEFFDRTALRVYGTYKTEIAFNAGSIIEESCDELHEEAFDRISGEAIKEMQDFFDRWAKANGGGTVTYFQDVKVGIIIPPKEGQ